MKFNEKIFNEAKFFDVCDFADNEEFEDFYFENLEDVVEKRDAIQLILIPADSLLLEGLAEYYQVNNLDELARKLEGVFVCIAPEYNIDAGYNGLYVGCGIGYDRIDEDLLNGDASGENRKKFIEFLNK